MNYPSFLENTCNQAMNKWNRWYKMKLFSIFGRLRLINHNTEHSLNLENKLCVWDDAFEWKFVNMENKAPDSRSALSDRLSETNTFGSRKNPSGFSCRFGSFDSESRETQSDWTDSLEHDLKRHACFYRTHERKRSTLPAEDCGSDPKEKIGVRSEAS